MMDIDLKWLLPIVLPFVFVALCLSVSWFVGFSLDQKALGGIAAGSILIGAVSGTLAAMILQDNGKTITINQILGRK